jgi:hypothetical protein
VSNLPPWTRIFFVVSSKGWGSEYVGREFTLAGKQRIEIDIKAAIGISRVDCDRQVDSHGAKATLIFERAKMQNLATIFDIPTAELAVARAKVVAHAVTASSRWQRWPYRATCSAASWK